MLTRLRNLVIYLMPLFFLAGCLTSEEPLFEQGQHFGSGDKRELPEKFEIRNVKGLEDVFKDDQTFIQKEGRYINVTEERKRAAILDSFIFVTWQAEPETGDEDDSHYVFQIQLEFDAQKKRSSYGYIVASEIEKNRFQVYSLDNSKAEDQWRELEGRVRRGVGSEFENEMYEVLKGANFGFFGITVENLKQFGLLIGTSFVSKEKCQEDFPQYWDCTLLTEAGVFDLLQFP